MMGKTIPFNTNYRPQLLIGLILGVWLYLFLVLIAPFDASDLSLGIRTILMVGYGVVFFLSYLMLIPIQNKLYSYFGVWKWGYEIAIIAFFCLCCLPVNFAYYRTELVNGTMGFGNFSLIIYLPTIAILLPVIFVGRYLVSRYGKEETRKANNDSTVTLLGDNKLDILKLSMSDLVALEAANNYVAVHYLQNGRLQKKLLRSTLRKLHSSVPEMIQVHRSYFVNMGHFVEWKDGLTLVLTQLTVPVSQKYKSTLLEMISFDPK